MHIWEDFNEIGDKQRSKVENLAKYVRLIAGGMYISNYYFGHRILTILHQNSDNLIKNNYVPIMFLSKRFGEKGNVGPRLFI